MADLTQTSDNVRAKSGSTVSRFTSGATIAPGNVVYLDATDNKVKLASTASATTANAKGVAITHADDGDEVWICTAGSIDLGDTLAVGEVYAVSDTGGAIRPQADNGAGDYVTLLGVASAADELKLDIQASGVAHA